MWSWDVKQRAKIKDYPRTSSQLEVINPPEFWCSQSLRHVSFLLWWKRMSLSRLQGFRRWNPINIQKKYSAGIHFLTRKCSTPHAGSPANKLARNQQKNRQRWYVPSFILTEVLCPTSRKGSCKTPTVTAPSQAQSRPCAWRSALL